MKIVRNCTLALTAVIALGLVSCEKENPLDDVLNPSDPSTQSTPPPTPQFGDSDGTLVAIKSQSTTATQIGPVTTTLGLGVGVFYSQPGSTTFLEAGAVSLNANMLTKQSNNSYVYQPDASNATGIDFNEGVSWSVSGSSNVEAFTYEPTILFPSVAQVSSSETVVKSNGYTLTTSSVSNADSVVFQVGSVLKTLPGNATTCSFTASELSALSTGTNVAQIAAYKVQNATVSSKNYYFINETVSTLVVTIE